MNLSSVDFISGYISVTLTIVSLHLAGVAEVGVHSRDTPQAHPWGLSARAPASLYQVHPWTRSANVLLAKVPGVNPHPSCNTHAAVHLIRGIKLTE